MKQENTLKYTHPYQITANYHGKKWIKPFLPDKAQNWILGPYHQSIKKDLSTTQSISKSLQKHLEYDSWEWPHRVCYFISDMHADADAFLASLVASGGVKKTGPKDNDFKLTKEGKKAQFILGGDYFDKGPGTIRLLRLIKSLIDKHAHVTLLTGNHDLRTLAGINSLAQKKNELNEHFFIRMGKKPLPFFKEIINQYHQHGKRHTGCDFKMPEDLDVPGKKNCLYKIYPKPNWDKHFSEAAAKKISDEAIKRETDRTLYKIKHFQSWCKEHQLSIQDIVLASKIVKKLFLHRNGEFHWFVKRLQLSHQIGSFFFVHAGIDDIAAKQLRSDGIKSLNKDFKNLIKKDLFNLYYGPIGNMIRTKYRKSDFRLTDKGVLMLRNSGVNAIVHGHRNLHYGQRIMIRKGMVNFECDSSMDINTRKKEGVSGYGASVTIIRPEKKILGISSDYPYIKVFEPRHNQVFKR
ncbi:MAG: metallophosphoesterase [Gammaproteobacteria bacterium]|nr:metallophosphoesterase [Gammaproteobacteria bacterium]